MEASLTGTKSSITRVKTGHIFCGFVMFFFHTPDRSLFLSIVIWILARGLYEAKKENKIQSEFTEGRTNDYRLCPAQTPYQSLFSAVY